MYLRSLSLPLRDSTMSLSVFGTTRVRRSARTGPRSAIVSGTLRSTVQHSPGTPLLSFGGQSSVHSLRPSPKRSCHFESLLTPRPTVEGTFECSTEGDRFDKDTRIGSLCLLLTNKTKQNKIFSQQGRIPYECQSSPVLTTHLVRFLYLLLG